MEGRQYWNVDISWMSIVRSTFVCLWDGCNCALLFQPLGFLFRQNLSLMAMTNLVRVGEVCDAGLYA